MTVAWSSAGVITLQGQKQVAVGEAYSVYSTSAVSRSGVLFWLYVMFGCEAGVFSSVSSEFREPRLREFDFPSHCEESVFHAWRAWAAPFMCRRLLH